MLEERRRASAYDQLMDEEALVVRPGLAELLGLNEAIVVQQLHYWLQKTDKIIEGRPWVYNTYEAWAKQFPWWSTKTIQRTITGLQNDGVFLAANFNRAGFDKTKWYTIDYDKLKNIRPDDKDNLSKRSGQGVQMEGDSLSYGSGQGVPLQKDNSSPPIPETTQRVTSETNTEISTPTSRTREDAEKIWDAVLTKLEMKLSYASFNTWFKAKKAEAFAYENNTLFVVLEADHQRQWIEEMHFKTINEVLDELVKAQGLEKQIGIRFLVKEGAEDAAST